MSKTEHNTIPAPILDGIIFDRAADGTFGTNVPWSYDAGHSPNGFETGYLGSGPTEFATNACAAVLGAAGIEYSGKISLRRGEIGAEAFRLRQYFKEAFIGVIQLEPGERYVLPYPLALYLIDKSAKDLGIELRINRKLLGDMANLAMLAVAFSDRFKPEPPPASSLS